MRNCVDNRVDEETLLILEDRGEVLANVLQANCALERSGAFLQLSQK